MKRQQWPFCTHTKMSKACSMRAIVLAREAHREYDQRITVLTQEYGKQVYIAKGVKKITSKNSGALEPCSVVDIQTIQGKESTYIASVHLIEVFFVLRQDMHALLCAQHIAQTMCRVLAVGEKDVRVYTLFFDWLASVDSTSLLLVHCVEYFYIYFLEVLGYSLQDIIAFGSAVSKGDTTWYYYSFADGRVYTKEVAPNQGRDCVRVSGACIAALRDVSLGVSDKIRISAQHEVREFLHAALEYYTEKPQVHWHMIAHVAQSA